MPRDSLKLTERRFSRMTDCAFLLLTDLTVQLRETKMNLTGGIALRRATLEDAETIALHRRMMFRDMGYHDDELLDAMTKKFLPWIKAKMAAGDYLAWLAVDSDHLNPCFFERTRKI